MSCFLKHLNIIRVGRLGLFFKDLQCARRLTLIDICMTFRENSFNSFEFKERNTIKTQFCD